MNKVNLQTYELEEKIDIKVMNVKPYFIELNSNWMKMRLELYRHWNNRIYE